MKLKCTIFEFFDALYHMDTYDYITASGPLVKRSKKRRRVYEVVCRSGTLINNMATVRKVVGSMAPAVDAYLLNKYNYVQVNTDLETVLFSELNHLLHKPAVIKPIIVHD